VSRLQRLAADIAAREHALAELEGKPGAVRERAELTKQLTALRHQRDAVERAEEQLREWIAPRVAAGSRPRQGGSLMDNLVSFLLGVFAASLCYVVLAAGKALRQAVDLKRRIKELEAAEAESRRTLDGAA